mmetsp:Transcript_27423/g.77192  ORF Transcript_27423/g.77192 Transcript_27423/m.77192 type:complete len:105 (-) Transcript_27423:209-523(-)
MALADARLVVAEHATGNIVVFDVATGFKIRSYSVTALDLMGLQFALGGGRLRLRGRRPSAPTRISEPKLLAGVGVLRRCPLALCIFIFIRRPWNGMMALQCSLS